MRFEAATIKDIARSLGYSPSTVSRALRDCNDISETTKQLVLDYAHKINYTPNPIALSLKARRSRTIGVIVHEIANSFFSQVINGIECVAREQGYNVIITQSMGTYENEMGITRMLASRSIDGCLVSVAPGTEDVKHFTNLQERGLPIVYFDRAVEGVAGHKVIIDNKMGGFKGTHHLLKNNCRRVAFIGECRHQFITEQRLEGYKKALTEHHMDIDESVIRFCPQGGGDYYEIESVMQELFDSDNKPDAIFTATDKLTITVMRCCHDMKIDIPGSVALAGFSNMENTELFCPSLTVLRQPAIQMGRTAARLLIKSIEAKRPICEYERQVLPVELRIGESSRGRIRAITA